MSTQLEGSCRDSIKRTYNNPLAYDSKTPGVGCSTISVPKNNMERILAKMKREGKLSPTQRKRLGLGPNDPIPSSFASVSVPLDLISLKLMQESKGNGGPSQGVTKSASNFIRQQRPKSSIGCYQSRRTSLQSREGNKSTVDLTHKIYIEEVDADKQ